MHRLCLIVGLGLGMMASLAPESFAIEFRIDTKLFAAGNKAPTGRNLTLFAGGAVYDFAGEITPDGVPATQQEIAILDTRRLKFVLLDTTREVKTEIDCGELHRFAEDLRNEARESKNPAVKFSADPKFTENFNRTGGLLELTSGVIDYRVETVRPDSTAASDQYGLFADRYAELNTTHPGAAPALPRIHLNSVLVKHGVIPARVERTIVGPGSQKSTAWTEHQVSWQLTRTDRTEITKADRLQVEYKLIKFTEYRQIAPMKK